MRRVYECSDKAKLNLCISQYSPNALRGRQSGFSAPVARTAGQGLRHRGSHMPGRHPHSAPASSASGVETRLTNTATHSPGQAAPERQQHWHGSFWGRSLDVHGGSPALEGELAPAALDAEGERRNMSLVAPAAASLASRTSATSSSSGCRAAVSATVPPPILSSTPLSAHTASAFLVETGAFQSHRAASRSASRSMSRSLSDSTASNPASVSPKRDVQACGGSLAMLPSMWPALLGGFADLPRRSARICAGFPLAPTRYSAVTARPTQEVEQATAFDIPGYSYQPPPPGGLAEADVSRQGGGESAVRQSAVERPPQVCDSDTQGEVTAAGSHQCSGKVDSRFAIAFTCSP